ncbi:MAG TPA: hypothetical protein VJP86_14655 [Vicinamibacterales bacterium]|jgi:hypothetical protein|nr:hypothetical protein [Vicinamibacterales bacterium]
MFRRSLVTVALLLSALPAWAQTRATYVLSNGERHNGVIVYGRGDNNLVDDKFHVNSSGNELVFERNDVAVIDFVGGTPNAAERNAVADPGVMIMRDGSAKRGTLHDIRKGDIVQWVDEGGNRNDYPISTVRRLYLRPDVARDVYLRSGGSNSTASAAPSSIGRNGAMSIRVDGNRDWTDSGMDVRRGDRIQFNSNGAVQLSPGVSVNPGGTSQRNPNHPAPNVGVGALIGRVGGSAPFLIGSGSREVTMPEDGRLEFGVNDDDVSDNSGSFQVVFRKR